MAGRILYTLFALLVFNFVHCDSTARTHNADSIMITESICAKGNNVGPSEKGEHLDANEKYNNIIPENYTFYDKVFWVVLSLFIVYVIYLRVLTNYRIDYPDDSNSPFITALISYRKMTAPDPYLDTDMKKLHLMKSYENGPLIAFWILWYTLGLFGLNELFGANPEHIGDLRELMVSLFIYFINIIGTCIVFDICVTAPMKYYE